MKTINEQPTYGFVYSGQSSLLQVIIEFFAERQLPSDEAELFYYYHASMEWHDENGVKISNWIPVAKQWINNLRD